MGWPAILPAIERIDCLELILTARCNLRCAYCYQNARRDGAMPWATLRAALDHLLAVCAPVVEVAFHGGEPLLEFDLIRRAVHYVRRARRRGRVVRFTLLTNGLRMDDEVATFLARHRVTTQLSFDGVPVMQERRAPGTFARLDALLDRLRRTRPAFFRRRLCINMTLRSATLDGLADSVDYFLAKDVRELTITPLLTHDAAWRRDSIETLRAQYARVLRSALRHHRATGEIPLAGLRALPEAKPPDGEAGHCSARAGRKIAVAPDGGVSGCVVLSEAFQRPGTRGLRDRVVEARLGPVDDPGLSPRLARLPARLAASGLFDGREERYSSYGRCAECRHREACGFCPVAIAHGPDHADPHRVPDAICAFNQVRLECRERFQRAISRVSNSGVG